MESLIEIAERRGEVRALLDYAVADYGFVLNDGTRKARTGAEFARMIRDVFDCRNDHYAGRRAAVVADIAEKYIAEISVRADGFTTWRAAK